MGIWGFKNRLPRENRQPKHALDKAVTNSELAVTYNLNVRTLLYLLKHWQGVQLKIRWYNFFLIIVICT